MIECSICKSRNNDEAIFCAECGQRLHPATITSQKLHSPLLDSHSAQSDLHSPLLDAWNNQPEQTVNKSSRLHSPVLDGPGQTNRGFEPEDLDMPVEEYNSLRSPLLAAKVPLPEVTKPPAEPVINPPAASSPVPNKPPTIQSLFGSGTDSKKSESEETYRDFASSLFDQSPVETGDSPAVRSPRQTGHFTKFAGIKKEERLLDDSLSTGSPPAEQKKNISSRHTLLPRKEELADQNLPAPEIRKSGFKVMAFFFLLASLVFKFWYCQALGAALFSSTAFLFDQIGQILIILLLFILISKAKL